MMKKWIFSFVVFGYAVLVILNLINASDLHYFLGIDDGSIVVKSNMVPDANWGKITTPSGPLIRVTHINPNNPEQLIINGSNENYLSLDHGATWSKIEIKDYCCLKLAVWVNQTILVSNGTTFMASKDFGTSWNQITLDTNSSEPIMIPEVNDKQELSWTAIPLSNLDKKTLSDAILSLNTEAQPVIQFSEASKYYFELNNNALHIKEKYTETADNALKIYRDNIFFPHGNIAAVLTVSNDGLWGSTTGGVFF